jgi:hypothetical protein
LELETCLSRSDAWERLRRAVPAPYRLRGAEDHFHIEPAWGPNPRSGWIVVDDDPDPRIFCVLFRGSLATSTGGVRLCGAFQQPRWFRLTSKLVLGLGTVLFGASLLGVATHGMLASVCRALLPGVFPSGTFLLCMLLGYRAGRRHYVREQAELEQRLRQALCEQPDIAIPPPAGRPRSDRRRRP